MSRHSPLACRCRRAAGISPTSLTQFDDDLTFSVQVDPATVDLRAIEVVFFDDDLGVWVPVAATVSPSGLVE
ncbi:MAG: hypothetical protein QF664_01545 [Dehalococcoidia bacterium]|jgi:hypothetical protein|nr:hypothetical protein [Dehalococcoidia bacterium]